MRCCGRHDVDELAQLAAEIGLPAEVDVPVEAHRLVLGEHEVLPHAAVEAVREREVDDPIGPAERNGRFRPIPRERLQPRSLSPARITANTSFILNPLRRILYYLYRFPNDYSTGSVQSNFDEEDSTDWAGPDKGVC